MIKPSTDLCGHVVGLWSLRGRPREAYSGLPKPYVELIVSLSGKHKWWVDKNEGVQSYAHGWVTPVQSGPRFAQTKGPLHLIGARLSISSSAALFGASFNRDVSAPIPLSHLIGIEAEFLRERLNYCPTELDRLACLESWLRNRLESLRFVSLPSIEDLSVMGWRTDALANILGLSTRGLRKRFQTQFGVGPKFWLQLGRFDSILKSEIQKEGLAGIAASHGYTDQAHMTSEFSRFAGRPPKTYLSIRIENNAPAAAPHFVPHSK